ncbi:MAG: cation:proton antiporter [Bdellovibrionaceae bacterium]|nr:cation:proton antiporter [Pseudobdellovibrionaceae bacterium]
MYHIPPLITDLALILMTAGFSLVACRLLKQPIVIGYILAGVLVSPHFPFMPSIRDTSSMNVWAEIGVIFLLFAIGLEFSYKKLASIGRHAFPVALIKVLFVLGLGYFAGRLFEWSTADSLFLGGLLSISSTAIIARTFEDLRYKESPFTHFVFGVLIIEDLFAIVLLVFLSTFAITQTFSGVELATTLTKLLFFIILCFVLGLYFVPTFFRKLKKTLNDETTLVLSVGTCLMLVAIATYVGFSPALGAFVMGSILAETHVAHNIEKVVAPLKYLFSAIFFVSIGMLIDPALIAQHWMMILIISIITIIGKFISTFLGSIMSGQDLQTSVKSGMTLAQIGEFSFIIATLGMELKVTSSFLYPIAIAVSVITSFLTPYLINWSDPVYRWLSSKIPPAFEQSLNNYSKTVYEKSSSTNFIAIFWDLYGLKIILNSTLIISIGLFFSKFILFELKKYTTHTMRLELGMLLITLIIALPFFWPILFGRPAKSMAKLNISFEKAKAIHVGIIICRSFISVLLISFIIGQFSSLAAVSSLLLLGVSIIYFPLSRYAETLYYFFEKGFIENIKKKD